MRSSSRICRWQYTLAVGAVAVLGGLTACGSPAGTASAGGSKPTASGTGGAASASGTGSAAPASAMPSAQATGHGEPTGQDVSALDSYTNCTSSGKPKNPNLTVAFAQTDLGVPWRVTNQATYTLWAKKLCIPHFESLNGQNDVNTELSNVSALLARKPNVLILDPIETQPFTPVVQEAAKAHVPLVVVDRALNVNPGTGTYQVFIGANQFKIGYQSAEVWIKEQMQAQHTKQPKGNIVLLGGGVGQQPATERNRGVAAAIKPYPGLKIVGTQSADWTRQGGLTVMESYLQRFPPGQIQGVFGAADESYLGARQAIESAHRTSEFAGQKKFFDGDGQLEGIEGVVSGWLAATTQNPPFYGQPALEAAVAISQGHKFHGATFVIPNRTFDCLTSADCQATKAYIAQEKLKGLDF